MAGTFGRTVLRFLASAAGAAACLTGSVAFAQQPQVKATKKDDSLPSIKWYGTAEVRHHINTYYAEDNSYGHQEPSLHVRLQLGAQFYDGLLDTYLTLGAYKLSETQQILQRRPELGADFHIIRHPNFELLQYNLFELPYRDTTVDPETQEDGEMGTVIMVGVAPTAKLPFVGLGAKWEAKGGFDAWTKLFSRKQYTAAVTDERTSPEDDEDEGHLGLTGDPEATGPIEDTAMHYRLLATWGVTGQVLALPEVVGEVTGNYFTKFEPHYYEKDSAIDYTYVPERYSYLRVRLQYQFNERWAVTNEFYDFYDSFFRGQRRGDERRYRNVARMTVKL